MFLYTVYGVPGISRQPARHVEKTAAVEPTRAVTSSWRAQYGNYGQYRRTYAVRQAQREQVGTLQRAQAPEAQVAAQPRPRPEPIRSEPETLYMENAQSLILQHRAPKQTEGDYIRKYVEQLNAARDRTVRKRVRDGREYGEDRGVMREGHALERGPSSRRGPA